jgi:hypothetical protein
MPAKWTFTKGQNTGDPAVMGCSFTPTCIFHPKTRLTSSISTMIVFPVEQGDGSKKPGHAMDITMVCPECGYREMFGVALHEHEADWMMKTMKGKYDA